MKRIDPAPQGGAEGSAPGRSSWLTRHRPSRGQALVELALILPVMLVLFGSALDLGRLYYGQITINNAAKEGALEAADDVANLSEFDSTRGCDAETNRVICLVINETKGSLITIDPSDVALACDPAPCPIAPVIGDTVEVTVTADFMLLSPILSVFFDGQTVPISASSIAQIGVEPQPGVAATPTPTPSASPSPTPSPTPDPAATPTPTPSPSPTPVCVVPSVSQPIVITPGAGKSADHPTGGTLFTMNAPTPTPQPGCSFTYLWSFGDGLGAAGPTATHMYQSQGTGQGNEYEVTLVISTQNAPTLTVTQKVKVTR